MRKLAVFTASALFSLSVFAQDLPDFNNLWDMIKKQITNGTFNAGDYNLSGLGGLTSGGFDMSQLPGGLGKLDFGEGGILGDAFGGLFGGLFGNDLMQAMGVDELHNDASLNNNVTWGILMTMKMMRPDIEKRQRKIMSLQDSINMRVKRLYELELLTVNYMSKTQSDAVEIEELKSFIKLTSDITHYYSECFKLCNEGGFSETKIALTFKVVERFSQIYIKVGEFAKKDGNKNLLHNQDRDELIAFVYSKLREMRGILAGAYRELHIGAYAKLVEFQY